MNGRSSAFTQYSSSKTFSGHWLDAFCAEAMTGWVNFKDVWSSDNSSIGLDLDCYTKSCFIIWVITFAVLFLEQAILSHFAWVI